MNIDVIVIGGGASGMIAAGTAGSLGKKVLLIEHNEKLGKKLYITGKGRCNLTNADEDIDTFITNTVRNGKFLYSAFSSFSNIDTMQFFEDLGLPLKIERGKRVFPESDKSNDVIKTLAKYMDPNQVQVKLNTKVSEIIAENNIVKGVKLENGEIIKADSVILSTGGASYPLTGSTGDGYKMAEKLGHTIIPIKPSIVPFEIEEEWVKNLQGISLINVNVDLLVNGKKKQSEFGEMLFTHFGVSGPIILTLSSYMRNYKKKKEKIELSLDLKPALDHQKLDLRLQRDLQKYATKQFKNSLGDLLLSRMADVVIEMCGIDPNKLCSEITREERKTLLVCLKDMPMTVKGMRSFNEAVITSGGVSTKEINPSTMESKLIKGLYFAGEVIDVDALTGGFNLQIAFSTGHLAGMGR